MKAMFLFVVVRLAEGLVLHDKQLQGATMGQSPMRPKAQWAEPLSAEEEAEFERDMRMPIKQWLQENPDLNSDYFVKFGMQRGYQELFCWNGVQNVNDYVEGARYAVTTWTSWPDYLGAGK